MLAGMSGAACSGTIVQAVPQCAASEFEVPDHDDMLGQSRMPDWYR